MPEEPECTLQATPDGIATSSSLRSFTGATEFRPLVLVGNSEISHVGHHFHAAAGALGVPITLCESDLAFRTNPLASKFNWWLRSHRPTHLVAFSRRVAHTCMDSKAGYLLTTGIAPVDRDTLEAVGAAGVLRMNFLTDDPWNRRHHAAWFMQTLPHYDVVFTPRKSNMEDLRRAQCAKVVYLPFAYAPAIHFPDRPATLEEAARYDADIFFAGGADRDRIPYFAAFVKAGLNVALYGGYWGRYSETRANDRGSAGPEVLRKAAAGARVALCLVRRANRDGHAMRTFELAASGACILAEDTEEHREILGPEGMAALYFRSVPDMLEKAELLLRDQALRVRLSTAAETRIRQEANTYRDRLLEVLRAANAAR